MNCVVCHYAEIGIKGKNRRFFEKRLALNIKRALPDCKVTLSRGRVLLFSDREDVEEVLKKIPGIANFSFAELVDSDMEEIKKKVIDILKDRSFSSFRITTFRSDKEFPLNSQQASAEIGAEVLKYKEVKVDLHSPQVTCFVEITPEKTYIYTEKIRGEGGLPVGTGGKGVALLSGGIDSPVSAFRMMRRGMKVSFVHFHAYPVTSSASIEKVRRIVQLLSKIQGESVVYLVPFAEVQKQILLHVEERFRVIAYRRAMMRIAEKISSTVLITGESLGQVASQTVENMTATDSSVNMPVFRPLIGEDKEGIIKEAKRIGSYDISMLPEEDCCARFLPRHPSTRVKVEDIEREEEKLDMEKIIEEALKGCSKEKMG